MAQPKPSKHMVLTVFMLVAGYYKDSWRLDDSRSEELGYLDFAAELAQMCEAAKLDAVFFGDIVSADTILQGDIMMTGLYEPITTLSAIAGRTEKIGLIGTSSTSFSDPAVLAPQLAALNTLSGGRAGWNIVTSWMGGENFGLDEMPPPPVRYGKAAEFVATTQQLWKEWGVERPTMVNAGASALSMDLGSSVADAIYTVQPDKDRAIAYSRELKAQAAAKGRDPRHIKILAGLLPIVGRTEAEAQQLADELATHINFDRGRRQFEKRNHMDTSDLALDDLIPPERMPEDPKQDSRYALYRRYALEEGYTLRDLIVEESRSGGHLWTVGTAEQVADMMIEWIEAGACDGFSLNPPFMPDGLRNICELLVPELQRRGYYREEYTGSTLREHLGLADARP